MSRNFPYGFKAPRKRGARRSPRPGAASVSAPAAPSRGGGAPSATPTERNGRHGGGEPRCGWGGRLHGFKPPPRFVSRVEQDQGATRSNSGQDHSLPELPASVRPPDHARPQTGQDTGQSRSADLNARRVCSEISFRAQSSYSLGGVMPRILCDSSSLIQMGF